MLRSLLILLTLSLLGATSALAAKFDHAAHNTYLDPLDCSACHLAGAKSIVPDLKVCLDCHDQAFVKEVTLPGQKTHGPVWPLNHRAAAKGNTPDCSACHQQSDCLTCHKAGFGDEMGAFGNQMVNVHRSDFSVSHPIVARTNQQLCASCHETKFCSDCHNSFAPADLAIASHRRGFTDGTLDGRHALFNDSDCTECHTSGSVIPSSTGWSASHAREARKNLATCQACHPDGNECIKCHGSSDRGLLGVNPHPKNWDDISGRLKRASDGKTCRKCH